MSKPPPTAVCKIKQSIFHWLGEDINIYCPFILDPEIY